MTTLLELTKKLHNTLALYNGAGHALGWKTEKVDKLLDESKRVIELAEQPAQQEPVAWLVCENWRKHSLFFTEEGAEDFKNAAQREDDLSGNLARWKAKPLYTSPPAQQLPFGVGGGLVAIKTLLSRDPCAHAKVAIEMIDAMLSEQPAQQESVACAQIVSLNDMQGVVDWLPHNRAYLKAGDYLYTPTPAQRKPLTRDQVKAMMVENGYDQASPQERADFINGIRHGEAAHGIKEQP